MVPDVALIDRFRADLDTLIDPGTRFGVAVSGGPDSLALLLLAASARPGEFEAATVDHGLRPESAAEAEMVAELCEELDVPHATLAIEWDVPPASAIQEQARAVRYGALAAWMHDRDIGALLTAHQLDDQAETLVMRLNRGSGVRGLAGMRRKSKVPDSPDLALLRPLLSWRRAELERICSDASVEPVSDPSNLEERFERIRIRQALAAADWLDPEALARSAENLGWSDDALDWATTQVWAGFVEENDDGIVYRDPGAPRDILRRIVAMAIAQLGNEGEPGDLRGRELDRLLSDLEAGKTTTLRGVRCSGGPRWTFSRAAPRSR